MKRFAPIVYGIVISIVIWSVFCCERGVDTGAVSFGDVGPLEWLGLGLTFVVVWGFVGTAEVVGLDVRSAGGRGRSGC